MRLTEILSGVDYTCDSFADIEIDDITYNSAAARQGVCFVCLSGTSVDGHRFAPDAYEKGCRCFFVERKLDLPNDSIQIVTKNTRRTLALISASFFHHPSRELKVIGITGTKGKTTVAHLVKMLIEASGEMCGIIGTVGAEYGNVKLKTANTTPESYEMQKLFRNMLDAGCKYCVIEASSLGLKMHRTDGIEFETGVFTNLSPDHIGTIEHPTFEDYKNSKKILFGMCKSIVFNKDDPAYADMLEGVRANTISFGLSDADITADNIELYSDKDFLGVSFDCTEFSESYHIDAALPGQFNAVNILAAVGVCKVLGIEAKKYIAELRNFRIPGRAELVRVSDDFRVIIDYAHNGLSLHSILTTLGMYPHNRLIALFGSIGEKNETRREGLGLAAGRDADLSILTSYNPGKEDPVKIAEEIAGYIRQVGGKYTIIADRREAVHYALSIMQKGDILLLAGKGDETTMKLKDGIVPYSEREEVEKYIKSLSK